MTVTKRILYSFVILLVAEVAGIAVVPTLLHIIRGWLLIWPAPTEHFAAMVGDLSWPLVALIIVWWLQKPIRAGVMKLIKRLETDELNLWGFSMKRDYKIPLDREALGREEVSRFTPDDVTVIEKLAEFAGDSEANARSLEDWILNSVDPNLDPRDFMAEPVFANDRARAYEALIGGHNG